MKYKLLLCLLASTTLSGCVTYSSEYANDGYYSSPRNGYNDYGDDYYGDPDADYDDGYYGSSGNFGQYTYGSGGYSSISFSFNFGPSYSRYRNYPSYYGYYQCSPWSVYCYAGYNPNYAYGWGYTPYYAYHHHHHHPKPKPPKHNDDHPEQNPDQPSADPGYPIVDRPDGPRPHRPANRPVLPAPVQQFGNTPPIANGGKPNAIQYPRQQPRPRPIAPPIQHGSERDRSVEREPYAERERYAERDAPRARPVKSEDSTNDYARFSQIQRSVPVRQNQTPRNRATNGNQQNQGPIAVAQQLPQQRAQAPRPERRERAESKQREPKAERERDGDKP